MGTAKVADGRDGEGWTPMQRVKNDLIYVAVRAALAVVLRLSPRRVAALCRALGALAHRVLGRERALARACLAEGLGAPPPPERVRAAFLTAASVLADTIALFDPREQACRTLSLPAASRDVFRAALAEGRGVVYVSGHLGPWERMAALLVEEGFPVATVARESYDPRLTRLYDRLRAPRGVRSIYRGRASAALAVVRELRRGGAVGFLIDLPTRVESAEVPLFGARRAIPVGAARIALATGAAVVVGTPTPDGAVRIERVAVPGLEPNRAGEQALLATLSQRLDERISAWPEAWLGLYAPAHAPAAGRGAERASRSPRRLRRTRDPR